MFLLRSIGIAVLALLTAENCLDAANPDSSISPGHNVLQEQIKTTTIPIGAKLDSLAFHDIDGNVFRLADQQNGLSVFVFMSTKCPLAKRYTQRLNRLHESYAAMGVHVLAVFPNSDETNEGVKNYAAEVGYPFRVVRDVNGYLAKRLGATMTPQVFVVDKDSTLRYHGAIDDNRYETRVKEHFLTSAVDAVLSGDAVDRPTTRAMGCTIHFAKFASKGSVTYSGHIARILQDNCQSCHRDGQVAPFSLTNYEEALSWATEIKAYTHKRLMPPWKAAPGFAKFKNDASLTEEEIALIAKWVEGGAPQGDPKDMPPAPKFHDTWAYGEPDLIVEMPDEYIVGPEGEDDYRHFIIPYEHFEDRYVETIDVQPGNRNTVHHVLAYIDTSGEARKLDAADPGPGYTRFGDVGFEPAPTIGGWAPGNLPLKTPRGSGRWLPKKCDIVLQVHYYRTGVEERDRTKVGIYFSKAARPVPVAVKLAINQEFTVPAGERNYEVRAEYDVEASSYLFRVVPHMHMIGETMKVTAHRPDGTTIPVIRIDDWDFNWQQSYQFQEFQYLPAGTKVKVVATFDNSAANPNNPNSPPQDIGWGEKTTDEMCIAFLAMLQEAEYDPIKRGRRNRDAAVAVSNSGGE